MGLISNQGHNLLFESVLSSGSASQLCKSFFLPFSLFLQAINFMERYCIDSQNSDQPFILVSPASGLFLLFAIRSKQFSLPFLRRDSDLLPALHENNSCSTQSLFFIFEPKGSYFALGGCV